MSKILLEVNGVKYDGFKSLGFFKSIEHASGTFNFTATAELKKDLPFVGQEKCRVVLDNKPLITGYIDSLRYAYADNQHSVTISGRDKTADVIDSTVQGNVNLTAGITLESLIKQTLVILGITDIAVINDVTGLAPFADDEIEVSKIGENAFDFLEKYCRKRGVLLTTNGDGDLVIARAGTRTLNGVLVNQIFGLSNNLKEAEIDYDFTKRYYKYVVRSQANTAAVLSLNPNPAPAPTADADLTTFEGTAGIAFDYSIRKSRVLEIVAETSSINESNKTRAEWEANIRRARSLIYSCGVNTLYTTKNEIFEPNTRIKVKDDFNKIDAIMLIRSMEYFLDPVGGTAVRLELVPPDAYTLDATRNLLLAQYEKIGNNT